MDPVSAKYIGAGLAAIGMGIAAIGVGRMKRNQFNWVVVAVAAATAALLRLAL